MKYRFSLSDPYLTAPCKPPYQQSVSRGLPWDELGQRVDNLACGLMAMGVQKGEKVALWATNVPQWIPLMFATAKIGAVLLPINTSYKIAGFKIPKYITFIEAYPMTASGKIQKYKLRDEAARLWLDA